MQRLFSRIHSLLMIIFFAFIAIQTHYAFTYPTLQSLDWNFGKVSLYGTDILFVLVLATFLISKPQTQSSKHMSLLFIFLGTLTISTLFFSINDGWYLLLRFAEGVVLAWMILHTQVKLRHLLWTYVAAIAANGLYGLWQFAQQSISANQWLGIAAQNPHSEAAAILVVDHVRYLRAYGTLPFPNIFGLYLAVGLIAVVWLFLTNMQQTTRSRFFFSQAALAFFASCILAGLIFSFSRSAWLGVFVGFFTLILVLLLKKSLTHLRRLGVLCLILVTVAAIFSPLYLPFVSVRTEATEAHEIRSREDRAQSYRDAVVLFQDSWWKGIGLSRSSFDIVKKIDPERPAYQANPVHNMFFLIAVEASVFSAIAFIVASASIFFNALKVSVRTIRRFAVHTGTLSFVLFTALLVMSFFGNYLATLPSGIFLLFLTIGLVIRGIRDAEL